MVKPNGVSTEDLYRLKSVVNPSLSPTSTELVYVITHIDEGKDDYVSHIYYQKDTTSSPVQWTFGTDRNVQPIWSPDGKKVAFLSNRTGTNQLYILSKHGGEAKQVTHTANGVSNIVWSPDSKKIAFSTGIHQDADINHSPEKQEEKVKPLEVNQMKYKSDGGGFLDARVYSQVGIVDLLSGEITQLTNDLIDYSVQSWSPDGTSLSVTVSKADDFHFYYDICVIKLETKQVTYITESNGMYGQSTWSKNGRYISYLGSDLTYKNATLSRLFLYDTEEKTTINLTAEIDAPVGDYVVGDFHQGAVSAKVQWSNDHESFYFILSDEGNTYIYYGNIHGALYPALHEPGHVYGFSLSNTEQDQGIVAISTPTNPGELYWVNFQTGENELITSINQETLETLQLAEAEEVAYESKDGHIVKGWMMKPINFQEDKKYPLIVEIHGGPHAMYANTYMNEFQILAAEGYAVLYVNPRGSHGYGQYHVDAVRGDYGGKDYEDIMAALDGAIAQYPFIDEDRLGVTGGSYGGFMTNWIVGHTDRFKAAVTQRSISNWISFYGVSDIGYYFTEWQVDEEVLNIEKLWKHSPLAYVKNVQTPLLILHGEKDYRCPIEQAEQLYISLKRLGKETKFVRFPESNHELSRSGKPSLRISRLAYIRDWFIKYL